MFFNWLPYQESSISLTIAPGRADSISLSYSYPDFIFVDNQLGILNGPGGHVVCDIKTTNFRNAQIMFKGSFALENKYYLAYYQYLGNTDNESRPYYNAGEKLNDFNRFPAIADSITQIRLNFLEKYVEPVSQWFKKHEYQRLVYNGNMRKYNVLIDKEFHTGKAFLVRPDYYSFEKQIKLINKDMILNTSYVWATDFYLNRLSKQVIKKVPDAMLYVIDSLCKNTLESDVLKMRRLGVIYTSSKAKYDIIYKSVSFVNQGNRIHNNDLIQAKLGLPKVGARVPAVTLTDINGKQVSLSDYAGKPIIINFWAIWCAPCIGEFPKENKIYQQYKNRGLVMINICIDSDRERWQQISKRANLQMINLFADAENYKVIKAKFNIGAIPRGIAIDRNFKVVDNYLPRANLLSVQEIEALIKN
ncbi:TlpA family protein disulfide reductase [Mucilaginibacter boryungensis]|uniref:TlpA family protein disulfide reductase n=1 Tax=Mucilaginibacter boryungensis TaxID=768480 RepID=A0ABR9XHI9_9SPHI|nr:TlpA disulfide reductase family protein [Mucilaginibacter boryungensis]MBE9666652.1 TlpA family protein disulfide reductase [Mucilaginibacter boryungensis]